MCTIHVRRKNMTTLVYRTARSFIYIIVKIYNKIPTSFNTANLQLFMHFINADTISF